MKTDPSSEQTAAGAVNFHAIKNMKKPTAREKHLLRELA
jgi:hypothetical protein